MAVCRAVMTVLPCCHTRREVYGRGWNPVKGARFDSMWLRRRLGNATDVDEFALLSLIPR